MGGARQNYRKIPGKAHHFWNFCAASSGPPNARYARTPYDTCIAFALRPGWRERGGRSMPPARKPLVFAVSYHLRCAVAVQFNVLPPCTHTGVAANPPQTRQMLVLFATQWLATSTD